MPEPKDIEILFTADAKYGTVPPVTYQAGHIESFRADIATRWISRGVATDDAELIKKAKAAAKAGEAPKLEKTENLPEGVPANWRTLNAKDAIAVAVDKLKASPLDAQNRAQAMAIIEKKVAELNPPPAGN